MKRKDKNSMRSTERHADPEQLCPMFPNLAEFMTAAVFEDGNERREAPTLTVWCNGGTWKASVKDRAEGLVLWLSAEKLQELFQLIEMFCLESEAPWRHDEQTHERNGKRVQKRS